MAGLAEDSPWKNLKGQSLLGGEQFITALKPQLKQKIEDSEIPRKARLVGRPQLSTLFHPAQTKSDRNKMIALAHLRYGYSQQEIASHSGLHYSSVSRIVQRERSNSKT